MSRTHRTLLLLLSPLLGACGPSLDAAAECDADDFEVVYAFAGPGWSEGALVDEPQAEYVAHATLALTRPDKHADFVAMMTAVQEQMLESDGLVALGRMGALREVEHLCLYDNVRTAAQLRALVGHELPRLTHLSLGHAAVDDAYVDVLCASGSFPALQALALSPWGPRLTAWAGSRGIARGCVTAPSAG